MILRELLESAVTRLENVDVKMAPGGEVTWSRGGRAFAVVSDDGDAAEFALDPAVAAAAMRTPDVLPSQRGTGWVRFRPVALDAHGRDRAVAWFESAHRRLGK